MGRVNFPTRNENGVRDLSKSVTLGSYLYDGYRGPAEPPAKASMNPVNLGGAYLTRFGQRPAYQPTPMGDLIPVSSAVMTPSPVPSSVTTQNSPTPQVTVPASSGPTVIYVTTGGGTASPAPAASSPAVIQSPTLSTVAPAASTSFTDQVASWLGGTTPLGSWNVPNALLAGAVALGVAMLMGGGGKRR